MGRLRQSIDEYVESKVGSESFTDPQATGSASISFGATPITEATFMNHVYDKTVEQTDKILGEIKGYEGRLSEVVRELRLTQR